MKLYQATITCTTNRDYNVESRYPTLKDEFDKKVMVTFVESCDACRVGDYGSRTYSCDMRLVIAVFDLDFDETDVKAAIKSIGMYWPIENVEITSLSEGQVDGCMGGALFWSRRWCSFAREANLMEMSNLLQDRRIVTEHIVKGAIDKDEAFETARATRYADSLEVELSRIYTDESAEQHSRIIAPHYLILSTGRNQDEKAIDVLARALYAQGRIRSRHIIELDLDVVDSSYRPSSEIKSTDTLAQFNDSLGQALSGNVVVIRYGSFDEGGTYKMAASQALERLVAALHPYLPNTQVIFAVPQGKADVVRRIGQLFSGDLVSILPQAAPSPQADPAAARAYLQDHAHLAQVEPDDRLDAMLEEALADKSFEDLDGLFETWMRGKIIREKRPQYQGALLSDTLASRRTLAGGAGLSAEERLQELIGLSTVKSQINAVIKSALTARVQAAAGMPVAPVSMHCAFAGKPGTGKTEVARLYGEILKDSGILKTGRVVTKTGSDMGDVKQLFEQAKGGVLFIDEAYAMGGSISEFIAEMENHRDETVVILAGYRERLEQLFARNEGFKSRIGTIIDFPDYSGDELTQIFELMVRKGGLELDEDALDVARSIFARPGRRADQGNGRFVRNLFEKALTCQRERLADEGLDTVSDRALRTIEKGDVERADTMVTLGTGEEDAAINGMMCRADGQGAGDPSAELDELIGLDGIKSIIHDRIDFLCAQKEMLKRGMNVVPVPMHMAFLGNPGTGKTQVAKLIGRILKQRGVLSVGGCKCCGKQDLVSMFVGGTALKVKKLFEENKGSVIFIDEAYSLASSAGNGGFGGAAATDEDAIAALIAEMENNREDTVVIMAGYTKEMNKFFDVNPGMRSRISFMVNFPDYSDDELIGILNLMACKQGFTLADGVDERVRELLAPARKLKSFGNARTVREMFDKARVACCCRVVAAHGGDASAADDEELVTLRPEDFAAPTDSGLGVDADAHHVKVGFAA